MAKSLFGSFVSAAAKAADKAIKQAAKERERERLQYLKQAERQRETELKQKLKHQAKIQGFISVFPRHKQIIDESINLIRTTNNLSVAKGRYETVMTHYEWMQVQKSIGMPLSFDEEPCGFESSLKRAFNENLLRIVEFTYDKEINSILKTKNKESRQKKVTKLRAVISLGISSLKTHENKPMIANSIKQYRENLNNHLK